MKNKLMRFLVVGLSVVFAGSLACAYDAGSVVSTEGKVDVLRRGEAEAVPLAEGDAISKGDIIRTKSLSKAEIRFNDDTVLRLAESTRLEIEEYGFDDFGLRSNAVINLERGEVRAIISKSVGGIDLLINTPNASGSAEDSDIFVFYNKSATGVLVSKGNASVVSKNFLDQTVNVAEGSITIVRTDEPPQEPRPYLDIEKKAHETGTTVFRAPDTDDPSQIKAVVVKLNGEVRVKRAGAAIWNDVKLNDIFGTGDQIETKETGMIEFKLDNGNVITLKPNSSIILTELSRDVETGDCVNLFEANIGNLRAKVEKLKGDSKFEIKTPTATAGVRGTTMFLNIIPGLTRVFFQDGPGTLTSIISQITKIVQDGQTSSADGEGNVDDPSEGDAADWTEGWDAPEAEPYTEPGPGEGLGEGGGDEGGGDEGGDVPDTSGLGGTDPVVDVPPDPTDTTPPPEAPLTFSGVWGLEDEGGGSLYANNNGVIDINNPAGEEYGVIASTTPNWWEEPGPFPIVALGTYGAPEGRYIWNTPFFSHNESNGSNMTMDGGAFFGYTAGIWNDGHMDGSAVGFYASPTAVPGVYDVGFLRSNDLLGGYNPANSLWAVAGTLTPELMKPGVEIDNFDGPPEPDINDENNMRVFGYFDGGGSMEGYIASERTYTPDDDMNWGIYDFKFGDGEFFDKPDGNADWSGVISTIEDNGSERFYLVADLSNGTWEDGEIRADVDGNFIAIAPEGYGESFLGRVEGDFYGVNDSDGTWVGTSIGTWVEEALDYGGEAEGSFGAVEDGDATFESGDMTYVFGGIDNLVAGGASSIVMIGEFDNPDEHTLWGGEFNDWVSDETKVMATMGGISLDSLLEGATIGLYIRDNGEDAGDDRYHAGYIRSSDEAGDFATLTGKFFNDIAMFSAAGNLTTYRDSPTLITPDELNLDEGNDALFQEFTEGSIGGDFAGTFSLESVGFDNEELGWGIWRAGFSGDGGPSSPFTLTMAGLGNDGEGDEDMGWLGTITGDGEAGKMTGTFKGVNLLSEEDGKIGADIIKGNIIGDYIDIDGLPGTDSWQALGVGEWVEITDLLTEENLGFTIAELQTFILDVPITQTYDGLLQGTAGAFDAGGSIAGIMDMSIFNDQIWTALISGTYSGPTGDTWDLALVNGADTVDLTGSLWDAGEWLADVSGNVNGSEITGAAGGLYGNGEFEGVGVGTVVE